MKLFHLVSFRYNGKLTHCSIYKNNKPYITKPLSRDKARKICKVLNGEL